MADKKDLRASLKQSEQNRADMLTRFGIVPLSILRLKRGSFSAAMYNYQREMPVRNAGKSQRNKDKLARLKEAGMKAGATASCKMTGRGTMAASIMPAELVEFFVKYYAKPGDNYLDPFMGQGVQMQVARHLGLNYYGYDLSKEFFRYIDAVRDLIDDGKTVISVTNGDSCEPTQIPDGIGDFSFHSPPYWDIEFYGKEAEQLGYEKSYEQFLDGMQRVAAAWLPKFKSGAYHVVNVNDFRKDGRFYDYHGDTIALFKRAGWLHHDTWIVEGLVGGMARAFAVDFNLKRIAPKFHEYALVFRAP
jgi:hypothetical protein